MSQKGFLGGYWDKFREANKKSYSSYWLGEDFFRPYNKKWYGSTTYTAKEKETRDLTKLTSLLRSVGNFVRILTKENIPVQYNTDGQSATAVNATTGEKIVYLSADIDNFDAMCGLALHEGSHVKLTDFKLFNNLDTYVPNYKKLVDKSKKFNPVNKDAFVLSYLKEIGNIVEDRRIDAYVYAEAPGYNGYYQAMYNKYFNAAEITDALLSDEFRKETIIAYEFRLINITNPKRDLKALKGFEKIYNCLDLKNMDRLKSHKDALKVAGEILEIIFDYAEIVGKPVEEMEDRNKQNQKGSGGEGQGQKSDEKNDEKSDGSGDPSDEKNDEEKEDNEGDGSGDGDEKEEKEDDKKDSNGNANEKEDEFKDDTNELSSDAKKALEEKKAKEQNDRATDPSDTQKDESNIQPSSKGNGEKGIKKSMKSAAEKQKRFVMGDVVKKSVSEEDAKKVQAISQSGVTQKEVGAGVSGLRSNVKSISCIVVKNMTQKLVDTNPYGFFHSVGSRDAQHQQTVIEEGLCLGTSLGRKIQIRNEEKETKYNRLKTGKLDRRLVAGLGYDAEQIFERTFIDTFKPVYLHISIDASGSMGGDKWNKTLKATVAICKAASMVKNIDVSVSLRCTVESSYSGTKDRMPVLLIAYDSRKDNITKIRTLWKYCSTNSVTPEGLCYEALLDYMMDGSNGQDSYFINFSDGEPYFDNSEISYNGNGATEHTAKQIHKMRTRGVKILSYFIDHGRGDVSSNFKKMYGPDSCAIDVNALMPLAQTINKMFTNK